MTRWTIIFLLLAGAAYAADYRDLPVKANVITISSLPYSATTDGTSDSLQGYQLSGNLTSTGGVISTSGAYQKFIGGGDTATFDIDTSGGEIGFDFGNGADHIVVESLTIIQGARVSADANGSYGGANCTGIDLIGTGIEYIYLHDVNLHVRGHSTRGVDNGGASNQQQVYIRGGNYTTWARSFDSRMSNDAAAIMLGDGEAKTSPDTFNYKIMHVTIDSACHAGILIGGVALVDSNAVTVDAFNANGNSAANAHGIADAGKCVAGSKFRWNTVRSGTAHGGARGMYFNFTAGTEANPVEMAYNDIRVSQGYTGEDDAGRGLRIRWGVMWLSVHDNYIEITTDDDSLDEDGGELYRGTSAHGIWFGAIGEEGSDTSAHNRIYNNRIIVNHAGASQPEGEIACMILDQLQDPDSIYWGNDNYSYNNYLESNVRCMQFGGDSHQGSRWRSYSDTFKYTSPYWTDMWGHQGAVAVGSGPEEANDNYLIDPIYISGQDTSKLIVKGTDGTQTLTVYVARTIQGELLGDNDLPVERGTVRMIGNADDTTTYTTDGWGNYIDTLNVFLKQWVSGSLTTTNYNAYDLLASKYAWNFDSTKYVTDTIQRAVTLSIDTATVDAPQAINDTLSITPGSDPERISILFSGWSNGHIAMNGAGGGAPYHQNIKNSLDTITTVSGTDTASFHYHSMNLNYDGGTPVSAHGLVGEYSNDFSYTGSTFDWIVGDYDRSIIWCRSENGPGPGNDDIELAGILTYFWDRPNREDSAWWKPLRTHLDDWDTLEVDGYDIVIWKNPQRAIANMNTVWADSLRALYQMLYDTCANHPERDFVLMFGFPRDSDGVGADSAGITYDLLRWFIDTLPETSAHNVHVFDSWGPMMGWQSGHYMEVGYESTYWWPDSVTSGDDHMLNTVGATLFQNQFIPFIDSVAEGVLDRRRGGTTVVVAAPAATPPVAAFSGTPTSGTAPLEVTFTDASTNTPTSWAWTFGDDSTSSSQNPVHTYLAAGTYTVTLTATNADGSDGETKTAYITVSAAGSSTHTYTIGRRTSGGGNSPSYIIEVKK